jgi:hypothetical protein
MENKSKNISPVKIISKDDQILFETSFENIELAYKKLNEFESMGIEVTMSTLNVAETLVYSLGKNEAELEEYRKSLMEEIHEHPCSDC